MQKIITSNISIIVQGAIDKKETPKCLKSIRKYLPDAEIILSTWEGSDVSNLDGLYDILVLNKDPQAIVFDNIENKPNNLNRIILSSQNGIKQATKKYVLRIRSDLVLKNNNILKLNNDFTIRNSDISLFKEKIYAFNIFSIKYEYLKKVRQKTLFHISDWCYLGLKEDIEELFNIPLVKEPDFSKYFEVHKKQTNDIYSSRMWAMSPEQYITSQNAKKVFPNLKFENYLDTSDENTEISEKFIINNFRIFSQKEWGIKNNKKAYKNVTMLMRSPFSYYSNIAQKEDYKKYCDSEYTYNENNYIKAIHDLPYFESLRKHFIQFIYCKFHKKLSEFISIIAYSFKFLIHLVRSFHERNKN